MHGKFMGRPLFEGLDIIPFDLSVNPSKSKVMYSGLKMKFPEDKILITILKRK